MDAAAAARAWIDAWQRAWPAEDVETIASRYADGAVYSSHPFRPADTARSYLERAFVEEALVAAWFGEPIVADERAAVEYWAVLRPPDGGDITIAGASFLHFDSEGLVTEHRDYWVQVHASREPPADWGR